MFIRDRTAEGRRGKDDHRRQCRRAARAARCSGTRRRHRSQFALTRQLGLEVHSLGVNLVDVLAGRAAAGDAIVAGLHGLDVIPAARELAGAEMSLVGELANRRLAAFGLNPRARAQRRNTFIAVEIFPRLAITNASK